MWQAWEKTNLYQEFGGMIILKRILEEKDGVVRPFVSREDPGTTMPPAGVKRLEHETDLYMTTMRHIPPGT
jgi:hypothetical protein